MNKPGQLNKRFLFDRGGQPTERLPPLIMSFSLADRETSPNDKRVGHLFPFPRDMGQLRHQKQGQLINLTGYAQRRHLQRRRRN
uniref:Uncharacterized protein n=1 Tax=Picea glauca TaxID=3330 RepID=A0A101LZZ0_PICGL|nr:hypothetical protein ABT39_MTgene4444 [Picea glauca]QHR88841.1 hypothetical protein Q903MT_gene2860 [Picea sitchensis]